ncbi:hypothetical protein GQ53DRAFT_774183 [Thozetella sp. PMI_491]|nr:hypothetical protein GQ53DRAFT_774183 [Thozetella sp. PMI_491]
MARPRQQTIESTLGRPRVAPPQVRQPQPARRRTLSSPLAPRTSSRIMSRHPISDGPGSLAVDNAPSIDEEEDGPSRPSRAARIGTPGKNGAKDTGSNDNDGLNDGPSKNGKNKALVVISSDDEDEEEDVLPTASFKSRRAAKDKSSTEAAPRTSRQEIEDEDDEEDDAITPGPRTRAASQRRLGKRVHKTSDEDDLPSSRSRRTIVLDSDDDSDNDLDEEDTGSPSAPGVSGRLTSAKRRRLLRPNQERATSSLSPAPAPELTPEAGSSPLRLRPKKQSKNQRAKDILSHRRKNKKSGRRALDNEEEVVDSEDESDEEEARALYDPDPQYQSLDKFDDEESSEENADDGPSQGGAGENNEDDDIAEDNSDEDNPDDQDDEAPQYTGPRLADMPFSHSADAHRPPDEQFYICVEWLVSFLLNPRAEETRKDAKYLMAWDKVNQLLEGLAHSTYISTSWKADFVKTLRARPKMESFEIDAVTAIANGIDHCTGCNRTNHPVKFMVSFQGRPYNQSTARHRIDRFLEEVEQPGDVDDGEDQDGDGSQQYDEEGRKVEPETRQWYLGSDCHANAEMTHMLLHWKRALFIAVEDRLKHDGRSAADFRTKSATVREVAVINTINDWDQAGFLSRLWADFEASKSRAAVEEGRSRNRRRSGLIGHP